MEKTGQRNKQPNDNKKECRGQRDIWGIGKRKKHLEIIREMINTKIGDIEEEID